MHHIDNRSFTTLATLLALHANPTLRDKKRIEKHYEGNISIPNMASVVFKVLYAKENIF